MTNPWIEVGLTETEYRAICDQLGREPNRLELGIFGVMWSEHCSYKNSRSVLKHFPTTGSRVLLGPGENAGVIDIGDGIAVVFKMESHNHPSAIEPYQGAATGVGGIIRDIFTMGARPIAVLDSLRFGLPDNPRSRYLLEGVVAGIAGYGNCIGLPTVGGELNFDPSYAGNPLVNVMCIGVMDKEQLVLGRAAGEGNIVLLAGASTGRDGLGGVSFASETLGEDSEARRPAVQVGDPFMEKLLVEACLEVIASGDLVGIQDLGGAGLSCATTEMSSRAGTGMEVDLDKVPRREEGMTPLEIMLSESQERMLLVVTPEQKERVEEVFTRWGLNCADIGRVTLDGIVRLYSQGKEVGALPAASITDGVPLCSPQILSAIESEDEPWEPSPPGKLAEVAKKMLSWIGTASSNWVWRQYDYMVRTCTVVPPGAADAAVLRLRGTKKGLAAAVDGNGRYCSLHPYRGGVIAVAEAARNLACVGAEPAAITDCLNFGDPNQPKIFRQFFDAVKGMAEACRVLNTPVVGGNVSFYNETPAGPIKPTPIVGAVGILDDAEKYLTMALNRENEQIYLLGETLSEFGGSLYQFLELGDVRGRAPSIDLQKEKCLQELLLKAHSQGLLSAAHDLSEGGLFLAAAEMALAGDIGVCLELQGLLAPYQELFSESQSRVLVSVDSEKAAAFKELAYEFKVPFALLGRTLDAGSVVKFTNNRGERILELPLVEMKDLWENALERSMVLDQ